MHLFPNLAARPRRAPGVLARLNLVDQHPAGVGYSSTLTFRGWDDQQLYGSLSRPLL